MTTETLTEGSLTIEQTVSAEAVSLVWRGKSNDREPGRFLMPLLTAAMEQAQSSARPLVLDFSALEYMNSSTFSPLVKALESANRAGLSVKILYAKSRRWQQLSFSALRAFATPDGRISFREQ